MRKNFFLPRGKKCSLFENFGVLCFLEPPVLRFALFALLPTKYRLSEFNIKSDIQKKCLT